jgi:hypothetical protein
MRKPAIALVFGAALLLAGPATAGAQVHLGPELSIGTDTDVGIGARLLVNVKSLEAWDFIGTFDWFFPDESGNADVTYWEINGNLAYNFAIEGAPSISPYVGAGLNIAHASVDYLDEPGRSNTDVGLNFLFGTQFDAKSIIPYVEIRGVIEGGDQVVFTGGILF